MRIVIFLLEIIFLLFLHELKLDEQISNFEKKIAEHCSVSGAAQKFLAESRFEKPDLSWQPRSLSSANLQLSR